ncbi:hypothetical protein [Galactobacillus timonensis]|uniref:hypothetical protein n=1 Tax=Galactobacillus timonensis TaxID=2041840 RepID=UPI000C816E8D|nr:hypothetical protein [Galactobacillus timonensis]
MTKMYYITDTNGNYYKIGANSNLVVAKNSDEATLFTLKQANERIGSGRKSRFYALVEIEVDDVQTAYSAPEYDHITKPTMFDSMDTDWEQTLSKLCYMSAHIAEYQRNLNLMLSDVDKEVCDLLHYLELNELTDDEMLRTAEMLQERRRHRRVIKDELEKTDVMRSTFLDKQFDIKVHRGLSQIEHMKDRVYAPRRLSELFEQHAATA